MKAFQLIETDAATAVVSRAPTKPVVLGSIDKTLSSPFAVVVQALPHKVYRLVEAQTQQLVKGQRLVRKGNNLLVEVDGTVMANLTGFFSNDAAPGYAETGATPSETKLTPGAPPSTGAQYVFDAELTDGSYGLINHTSQGIAIADDSALMWAPGQTPAGVVNPQAVGFVPIAALGGGGAVGAGALLGGAAVVGVVALAGGGSSGETGAAEITQADNSRFVQGVITAGDVVASNDLRVEVYSIASNGAEALLNTGAASEGGAYRINIGSYSGAVRVKVINTGTQDDYLDEASGKTIQLSAALEALGMATGLSNVINITPVTHLASLKNTAPASTNIEAINTAVGQAFGLTDITTAQVITITNTFNSLATASLTQSSVATTDVIYAALAQDTSSIAYTISGTDSGLFNISAGGAVTFKATQAASTKSDSGADGTYNFTVTATDAAGNARTQAVAFTLSAPQPVAGQATIDLGTTNGKLILGVQVEGKWYYHWDRSGGGSSATDSGGQDFLQVADLNVIFNKDINGTVTANGTSDTYRYATLNGVKVALPTTNGGLAYSIGTQQNGTSYTDAGPSTNGTSSSFNELLAIWDAYNGTGTGSNVSGKPTGWGDPYYSATRAATGQGYVTLNDGFAAENGNAFGSGLVALQVLNPATFTATSYERATDTFKLTGTDMSSLGEVGTDIKGFIDWTKFGYDTNADGVADVTFAQGDIASAKVTSDTGLEVVLGSAKATALETADGFDSTSAAVGNADKLILATNAANTYSNAANVSVRQSLAGQLTIDLGNDGKLINGVQVEGKWYYHWDRSGDGTSADATLAGQTQINGGVDTVSANILNGIFTQTLAQLNAGTPGTGTSTTDTIRYTTLNGVQVALPTYGAGLDGSGKASPTDVYKSGTSASNNPTADNPTYNDLLAIWDSQNGAGTFNNVSGIPAGWQASSYWSATPSASGHAAVLLNGGGVYDHFDYNVDYVALQVL